MKIALYVCLTPVFGLAFVYLCGYLSARCEAKLQAEEHDEEQYIRRLLAEAALTYPQAPDPIEQTQDLQWLQQSGFTEISANGWVN